MSRYPDLARHCPIEHRIGEAMDGSFCRRCRTIVHDLDALGEAPRLRLLAGAQGQVCIRYRLAGEAALTAAALIAAGMGSYPASAQDAATPAGAVQKAAPPADATAVDAPDDDGFIVGVMSMPTRAERQRYLREARRAEREAEKERKRAEKAARQARPD